MCLVVHRIAAGTLEEAVYKRQVRVGVFVFAYVFVFVELCVELSVKLCYVKLCLGVCEMHVRCVCGASAAGMDTAVAVCAVR